MTFSLDPRSTALVLIDLQKGTTRLPLAPYTSAGVIEKAVALGRKFEAAKSLIVRVRVAFAADGADRLNRLVDSPPAVPPGGWPADFAEIVPEIAALAGIEIVKRQWGAFFGTELDLQLRRRGISTIVLCGIATNFGVESTAREAWQHNYDVVIAEDACSGLREELHRMSMEKIMPRIGRVRKSQEIIAALSA